MSTVNTAASGNSSDSLHIIVCGKHRGRLASINSKDVHFWQRSCVSQSQFWPVQSWLVYPQHALELNSTLAMQLVSPFQTDGGSPDHVLEASPGVSPGEPPHPNAYMSILDMLSKVSRRPAS